MGIYLYKPIPTANTFFKNKKLKLSVQWFSWKLSNCKNQGQIIKSLYFVNPEKLQVMTFSIQLTELGLWFISEREIIKKIV